ncbi:ABC transporter ATP-binding protein [Paramagnetospirillum marisnigri]|uniref:ABC transporter ATP-binding protein n=1 Tax=Paramagnetospirillum marisnigri TaxID=1285242 RepID=A0A178MVN4_9PROT|nr:ATP-binding cassette domain-containing protein [Paramagnetospirillum marisnigri]OAN54054.1 ABC transporter ATP-binding protein [Paramagnetospirillum marisnigri]
MVGRDGSILPLELSRVGFSAGGRPLIRDISLRLEAGSRTLVLGPNGAGKSLLLRLCHGLLTPTGGSIRWGDGAMAAEGLRRRQAMVFQRPVLLRRSALANIRYVLGLMGMPRHRRQAAAMAALARFDLADLALRPARVLSGGEQQRLALARAWVMEPEILFLDEPTSALDPAATQAVETAIQDFHGSGAKIVMTTHDLGQARRLADEVVFLAGGALEERTPASIFFKGPASARARAFLAGELVC